MRRIAERLERVKGSEVRVLQGIPYISHGTDFKPSMDSIHQIFNSSNMPQASWNCSPVRQTWFMLVLGPQNDCVLQCGKNQGIKDP